ncbi:MAG: hypothetical protein EB044_06305, partial [Actinobacteria bacterium]|nr:hypothetical protein [Actinomycetota bacterium]
SGATASGNITLAGATTIKNSGSGTLTLSGTIDGGQALTITNTGTVALNGNVGAGTALTSISVSGASSIGANITTSSTQNYTGAVTLTTSPTLTTTSSAITFSSTVNSSGSARDLTFGAGSGNATFTGAVGTTLALGTITNIAGQTVTFSDAVTATTIANYGTLLFNATSAKTISAAITDNDTTIIQVINSLTTDVAPGIITFSGTVATDTLTIGSGSSGGSATFTGSGGVTAATTTITGGSTGTSKNSTATFNYALSGTSVTLDDVTSGGTATIVFAGANSVTIAPTIAGASAGEGTISITGTNKTFTGEIGGTNGAANVGAINIAASQTGTFKNNVAATTTTTSGTMVIDSAATPAAITVRGAINGSAANTGNLTVQN